MRSILFLWLFALSISTCADTKPIFLDESWESGYIKIDQKEEMFYWFFRARSRARNAPLVLWLQGGPGCSDVHNVLGDNGPYRVMESLELTSNPFSWNNEADLLYVDQPLGVGFSNVSNINRVPRYESEVAEDMRKFMIGFVGKHGEYSGRSFYISGHSYGGHYVPAIAKYFLETKNFPLVVKGIAVGNGWFDPKIQTLATPAFDWQKHLVTSIWQYVASYLAYFFSALAIQLKQYTTAHTLANFGDGIANGFNPRFNVYDIRKKCDPQPLCYNFSIIQKFMDMPVVHQLLGVGNRPWKECYMDVFFHMLGTDYYLDMNAEMIALLDQHKDLKVVVYTGNMDWSCNSVGVQRFMDQLNWYGKSSYNSASWQDWFVSGTVAGRYKRVANLTYYDVYDAGHLVTMDQPEAAYDILMSLLLD